ncbi:retroviral aspartyl protease family protein [Nephila pilipes]|uniref:Retroviral aspartyl protease family protein n=1 Tax=Nephila pilipes TaxID=299642 RepID=A0A8X6TQ60_NEPPI|nr:retroviral aspartyl protease family protein [Nephila pilipes]
MIIDTGANVAIIRTDLDYKLGEKNSSGRHPALPSKLIRGVLVASSLVDLSRNVIPVRVANIISDKAKVIKEGEVLATCTPVTCINRIFQATLSESSDSLINELIQSAELDDKQRSAAGKLLRGFEELFSRKLDDVRRTKMTRHRTDTGNHLPIKQHPRRLPFAKQEEVANLLMKMQQNDIIEPSESPWASPIILVRKKDD